LVDRVLSGVTQDERKELERVLAKMSEAIAAEEAAHNSIASYTASR